MSDRCGPVCRTGMHRYPPVCRTDMDRYVGPIWTGMSDRYGPVCRTGMDRYVGPVWTGMDRYGPVWTGMSDRYQPVLFTDIKKKIIKISPTVQIKFSTNFKFATRGPIKRVSRELPHRHRTLHGMPRLSKVRRGARALPPPELCRRLRAAPARPLAGMRGACSSRPTRAPRAPARPAAACVKP